MGAPTPTGLILVDGLAALSPPTIGDYCAASAEYIRSATTVGPQKRKAAQIRLSAGLAEATVASLRSKGLGRTFAVNLHLKFPFAVVGGILTLPTTERVTSGDDLHWKSTTHLIERAVIRFMRAGGRQTEGDAGHLLEGIAVVVFDRVSGLVEPDLPPVGCGLRWEEFIDKVAEAYAGRFSEE